MNTFFRPILLGSALFCSLCTHLYAKDAKKIDVDASVNIGATTDYMWRGVSQNDNTPALSGGIDLGYNNFYVGTWASHVDNAGGDIEIDLYGGYKKEGGRSQLGYDIGVITYQYMNLPAHTDFTEAYVNLLFLNNLVEVGYSRVINADDKALEGDQYTHVTTNSRLGPFTTSTTIGNTVTNDSYNGDSYYHLRSEVSYDIPYKFGSISLSHDIIRGNKNTNDAITSLSWTKSFDY